MEKTGFQYKNMFKLYVQAKMNDRANMPKLLVPKSSALMIENL